MFKAFLRTDGTVVVTGGDSAWKYQKRHFQRLVTASFAYQFEKLGQDVTLSDMTSVERTVSVSAVEFVGSELAKISESEYMFCRSILKDRVKSKKEANAKQDDYAVAG